MPNVSSSTSKNSATKSKAGTRAPAKGKAAPVELAPGTRVQSRHFTGGTRAMLHEIRRANVTGAQARLYPEAERNFGRITTDDGQEIWDKITKLHPIQEGDVYEEGRSDPEAFWTRIMALPILARAQEIARATGGGGIKPSVDIDALSYPPRSRRTAGFLSSLSIERAAQVVSAAFPTSERPSTFDEWVRFEKSGREFDSLEWQPFQGQKGLVFRPAYVVGGLVAALAHRVAHESEATKKAPGKLVSKAALAALRELPEASPWLKFFAYAKPVRGVEIHGVDGKFDLPGKVVEGSAD